MKYLAILLLLCATASKSQSGLADSIIQKRSLQETLLFLSQDSLKGRLTGTKGAETAATFIAGKFKLIGLTPVAGNNSYFDCYTTSHERKKVVGKNVVGMLPSKFTNDTTIIFSAHYDHIGQKNDLPFNNDYTKEDDIFNGANDNATGVAALLELAKFYKAINNNRYQLLFIAFSGEEMGMLGSAHFIKKIKPGIVKAVINLEMLGRPVAENCFIISFSNTTIRNKLNRSLEKYQAAGEKKILYK